MSDTIDTGTSDDAAVEQPKATPWPVFAIAIALYVAGVGCLSLGLHFDNEVLVVASVVPYVLSIGALIAVHGYLH